MATPTPANRPSGQAVATPPVSTPFSASHNHLAFSPHGPKSVQPSPQHIKKSPANSSTLYGYPAAAGNHPTNSSFGAGYDSPSAAMALGGAGVGGLGDLGMEGIGTPSGGLSSVGLSALAISGAKGDEQDRTRRLELVKDILKSNKGRLSEAGLERLAKRINLQSIWEDSPGGSRTLVIAGEAFELDIKFTNNVVQKVVLLFSDSPENVNRHTGKAGEILMRDLHIKDSESPLTKMLDRFAGNLERLAILDRLCVVPGLNCHEAIAGVYDSLEKLHAWEVEKLGQNEQYTGKAKALLVREIQCTGSGKPIMHARDRLGLSLDYWEEKRRVSGSSVDGQKVTTWSLLVECAPISQVGIFAPLRVSSNWISADIQKANPAAEEVFLAPEGSPVLDWQEPENILLPIGGPPKGDAMGVVDQPDQKFPEVIFIAKFEPPVVVPYDLAVSIYNSTNAPIDFYAMSTFDGLLLPPAPGEKVEQGETRTIKQDVFVPVFHHEGEKCLKTHSNTLMVDKIELGHTLTEIPFSHPNQLVGMLPVLRQYAFLSTVLRKSFGANAKIAPPRSSRIIEKDSELASFEDFISNSHTPTISEMIPADSGAFSLDVSFTTQPHPRLIVVFPFKGRTANVTFEIRLNGVVEVASENVLPAREPTSEEKKTERALTANDLGRMLEITEDLGVWAEFVVRRLG